MFSFKTKKNCDCSIIKKHFILLLFSIFKFIFFLILAFIVYKIYAIFWEKLNWDNLYIKYILFFAIFTFINYSFIKLILDIIEYNNNLLIIQKDHIIILKASLILQDDIEFIDSYRVMKIDAFCRWFLANIVWYWNLVIEQQKDDVRVFHFIPRPFRIVKKLREQKDIVLKERKKKYIITDEKNNLVVDWKNNI